MKKVQKNDARSSGIAVYSLKEASKDLVALGIPAEVVGHIVDVAMEIATELGIFMDEIVAERIAKEQGEKARKAEADARLRADVADTDAGRAAAAAGRGGKGKGGGKRSRVSWKKAAADLSKKSAAAKEALEAQVRELKVQLLAAQALAPRPPAAHPPAAAPPAPRGTHSGPPRPARAPA